MALIRRASVDDAGAIAAVHVLCWRQAYADILPAELLSSLSVEARAASRRRFMADPGSTTTTLVAAASAGGDILGFADCGAQRTAEFSDGGFTGEFLAIYLLRHAQRAGVGRSLIAAMADDLATRGHAGATVWVLRDNASARRFYEALSGELVGEREDRLPEHTYLEVAYGWRELTALSRPDARAS